MISVQDFRADPAFEAGSVLAADWPLCQVRLQNDARFIWLILLPRIAGAIELDDLGPDQRHDLMDDMVRAGVLVRKLGQVAGHPVDKLNTATLGNVTAQLHIHVVGRHRDDEAWPDPVWGKSGARPLDPVILDNCLRTIRDF